MADGARSSRKQFGETVSLRKRRENLVLVRNKRAPFINTCLVRRCFPICQYQQGNRLVFFPDKGNDPEPWPRPFDPFDIEPLRQFRESEQQAVEQRAMPAEKPLTGMIRCFKPLSQQKQSILFQHFHGC